METPVMAPQTGFAAFEIPIHTQESLEFVDITDEITSHIAAAAIRNGMAIVTSSHTTAAIVVNEHEPELLKDLRALLSQLAPEHHEYAHNGVPCGPEEVPNGHSHCRSLLLGTSATIPVVAGRLVLGRYQRVFLVELDHARYRSVTVAVLGI